MDQEHADVAERIGVIGLGYVGLPLALALGRHWPVVGFDTDADRIACLSDGKDDNGESEQGDFSGAEVHFTCDGEDLRACDVFIVAVPTPVNQHNYPDLQPLLAATQLVGRHLREGAIVVFESTVFPGATEEICVPLLEETSGMVLNQGFSVGYSPERVNPGDKDRRLPDIVKLTSGSSREAADRIDALYRRIITAGTHRAPSIRVAEAAKAIENTQRDVNIALVNELAMLFNKIGIDTQAVLDAAATKWNFLPFRPGLVGGHCIGVDPYYLIHKAQEAGYHPELILAARRINNDMARHVTNQVLRLMARARINVVGARVLVLGLAFKENCPDLRNTQVANIVRELQEFHALVDVYDPWVDAAHAQAELAIKPIDLPTGPYDVIMLAVAHQQFAQLDAATLQGWRSEHSVVYDIKGVLDPDLVDGKL